MLFTVKKLLKNVIESKGLEVVEEPKGLPFWKAFVKNQFLMVVAAILFLLIICLLYVWIFHANWSR